MTQTAQELRFSHDAQGRIVFNGQPYLYLSAGSLPEGQRRAEQKAAWMNECLDAAIKAQLITTELRCKAKDTELAALTQQLASAQRVVDAAKEWDKAYCEWASDVMDAAGNEEAIVRNTILEEMALHNALDALAAATETAR